MADSAPELIPALPEDVAQECLLRVSYRTYPHLRYVCRRWKSLLTTAGFHQERRLAGLTEHCVCFIQALPEPLMPYRHPSYGVSVYDARQRTWERLPPVPGFPHGLPLFCQCVAVAERLVLLGGWNPDTWEATKSVFIFDFACWKWIRGADMLTARSFFAAGVLGNQVLAAGGHDEGKNALCTAEIYDAETDTWAPLPAMGRERDECKGAVAGGKFYVVSGYESAEQGQFMTSAEVYDPATGLWTVVENMWPQACCPHVLVTYRNTLYALQGNDWTTYEPDTNTWKLLFSVPEGVRSAPCATVLGDSIFHPASFQSSSYTPFSVRPKQESSMARGRRLWSRVSAKDGFNGFPQAACTVEI